MANKHQCYRDRNVLKCSVCHSALAMTDENRVICPKCDKEVDQNDCAKPLDPWCCDRQTQGRAPPFPKDAKRNKKLYHQR
jgi:hypothetical protein